MRLSNRQSGPQSGNVIFIILIGIVLFAALSYAVTYSTRDSNDSGGNEKTNVQATEFLTFGQSVANTIKALKINGCTDTQINFDNSVMTGYTNASAPADKSCNVFDTAGGGLQYITPSASLLDSSQSANPGYGQWVFTGRYCLLDVGTGGSSCSSSNNELILILENASSAVCNKIQTMFGITYSASNGSVNVPFQGSYATNSMLSSDTSLSGKTVFCYKYSSNYRLVYLLLPR